MRFRKKDQSAYLADADVQLMLAVKKGDRSAFDDLMRKYYVRILNFSYRFTGSRQLAEDLTQDVFMKVFKSAARYRPRSKFQTWLYTIAKNTCLNEMRRHRGQVVSLDEPLGAAEGELSKEVPDPDADPSAAYLQKETEKQVRAAIHELPENQKIAVILARYDGFTYAEIAATLDVTDKAVKSLLSRAKGNLKNRLAGMIDPD
ncbi:MAG: sigma-70 family RNA polymerase sigma factor [Desulfobacterales bacterium]|nr:sigma-70 family RNA polymerase sigma factor [Desulfobacterales bacterium]